MPDQVEVKVNLLADGSEQLDRIASSLGAIEHALVKTTPVLTEHEKKLKELAEQAEKSKESIKTFGEALERYIETPGKTASQSIRTFLETMGPFGVGVAASVGVVTAFGTAVFESAEKLGALGTQITNISIRTGLSTKEVGLFTFAAKAAGADIGSFETGMKMLSRALADNSEEGKRAREEMSKLGIAAHDMHGAVRPTSEIFLDIGDALNKADGAINRNAIALAVLGRAGLELVPTLMKLRENLELAKDSAEIFTTGQITQMEEYHKRVLVISAGWDRVGHSIEMALASAMKYFDIGSGDPERRQKQITAESRKEADEAKEAYDKLPSNAPTNVRAFARQRMTDAESEANAQKGIYDKTFLGRTEKMAQDWKDKEYIDNFADIADSDAKIAADKARFERGDKGTAKERAESNRKTADEARDAYFGIEPGSVLPEAADALKTKWLDAEAAAKKYEAALKGIEASEEALKKAEAYINRPPEGGTAFDKIIALRDATAKNVPGTIPLGGQAGTGERGKVYARADQDLDAEEKKNQKAWDKRVSGDIAKNMAELDKEAKAKDKRDMEDFEEAMAPIDRAGKDRRQITENSDNLAASTQRSDVIRQASKAQRMAELSTPLGSGAQGQQTAINDAYQIRIGLAQRLSEIDLDRATKEKDIVKQAKDVDEARAQFKKESQEAEIDREMKLLELAQKQKEEARSMSDSLFDAITSKDPSKGVQNFFLDQAKGVGKSVFSNLTAPIFGGMQASKDALSSIGASHSPEMIARKADTEATKANTAATIDLTNAFTYSATGGSAGKLPSGSGTAVVGGPASLPGFSQLNKITGGNLSTGISSGNSIVQLLRKFYNIPGGGGGASAGGNNGGDQGPALWDFSQDDGGGDYGTGDGGGGGGGAPSSGSGAAGGGGGAPSAGSGAAGGAALAPQSSPAMAAVAASTVASKATAAMSSISASLKTFGGKVGEGAASVAKGQAIPTIGADLSSGNYAGAIGAGIGLAGATYAGVKSALHDFSKGGAYGVIGGIGAVAQTAANFDPEPISHAILESVSAVSGLVTAIMGDPRQARQNQINKELTNDQYNSTGYIDQHGNFVPGAQAKSISYFGASNGQSFDTNFQGGFRTGSFASTTRNVYDPSSAANQIRNGSIAPPPGYSFDQATGYGDRAPVSTGPLPSVSARGQVAPIIQVTAMDAKSFLDHAADISAAVRKGIQMGHPVVGEIQQVARNA